MRVIPRAGNLGVVSSHYVVVDEQEGGARVGDAGDAVGIDSGIADCVAGGGEGPEALAVIHSDIGYRAGIFRRIRGAESVGAWLALLEVYGEQGGREAGFDVIEEGELFHRLDCIDGGEGESKETIVVDVSLKLLADFLR